MLAERFDIKGTSLKDNENALDKDKTKPTAKPQSSCEILKGRADSIEVGEIGGAVR